MADVKAYVVQILILVVTVYVYAALASGFPAHRMYPLPGGTVIAGFLYLFFGGWRAIDGLGAYLLGDGAAVHLLQVATGLLAVMVGWKILTQDRPRRRRRRRIAWRRGRSLSPAPA